MKFLHGIKELKMNGINSRNFVFQQNCKHDVVYSSEKMLKKCAFCNAHFPAFKLICVKCKGEYSCPFILDDCQDITLQEEVITCNI